MIVATTAIPGSEEKIYLDRFKSYCEERGKKIGECHTGKRIFEIAKKIDINMTDEYVLNTPLPTINALRHGVLTEAEKEIPKFLENGGDAFMVTLHTKWYWDYRYQSAFDRFHLFNLNPDIYVNFLNNVDAIEENLRQRKQWQFLFSERRPKNYAREKILDWQSVEFEDTLEWARLFRKPFFCIPSKGNPSILYRLIFEPWRKIYYFGMPLTLLQGAQFVEARGKIDSLLAWLERLVTIIDPRYVEPLSPEHLAAVDEPVYFNVTARDLDWLIPTCKTGMIAYSPVGTGSAGKAIELKTVKESNRETNLIYPADSPISPFYVRYSQYLYRSEEEFKEDFIKRLGEDYLKRVDEAEKSYNEAKHVKKLRQ